MARARKVVAASIEAFNTHDEQVMRSHHADRVVFRAPGGVKLDGADATVSYQLGWLRAFPDAEIEVIGEVANGDWVAQRFTFRGTHADTLTGPEGEIPATDRAIAFTGMEFIRVEDGKIAEIYLCFDRTELLRQLGLTPELVTSA